MLTKGLAGKKKAMYQNVSECIKNCFLLHKKSPVLRAKKNGKSGTRFDTQNLRHFVPFGYFFRWKNGGGGGSRTRVPTRHSEDIYMLVPSSTVYRPSECQWTGVLSGLCTLKSRSRPNAGVSRQGTDWRRLYLSTRSGTATWRDYAANAYSSFAVIVLTGD